MKVIRLRQKHNRWSIKAMQQITAAFDGTHNGIVKQARNLFHLAKICDLLNYFSNKKLFFIFRRKRAKSVCERLSTLARKHMERKDNG